MNNGLNTQSSSSTFVVFKRCCRIRNFVFFFLLQCAISNSSPIDWATRRLSRGISLDANDDLRRRSSHNSKSLLLSLRRSPIGSESRSDEKAIAVSSEGSMWPPWPFNLVSQRREKQRRDDNDSRPRSSSSAAEGSYRSNAQLFWDYFQQRARIGARQMQQVGSDLWLHLPPAAPPLMLIATLPRRVTIGELTTRTPPFFRNAFARGLVMGYVGVAILSWSHSELNRKRHLVPLPLMSQYQDVQQAVLPHFLPEEVAEDDDFEPSLTDEEVFPTHPSDPTTKEEEEEETMLQKGLSSVPPKVRRQLQNLYDVAPDPRTLGSTVREWNRVRESRRRQQEKVRRQEIMDELIALKLLKKTAEKKRRRSRAKRDRELDGSHLNVPPLGYALVTGASRGIGRAIAVELARWDIPLILVARDQDSLSALANEIETCYGVRCCVLPADLSKPHSAEKIHKATREAGLRVDILVNNAGVCSTGLSVDMPLADVKQMVQVNAMSVTMLNHLYGRDMKEQRRGRILVVSSVVGCSPAGPQVATYAATKAFEKNLALSMGKELEPYGVGVTCLMPGAVRNTWFRSTSGSEQALCWTLPGYTRTAPKVAHEGVRAMLAGQTEVCPGWQNRAFVKLMTPMLPQRLTALVVETAWSPPSLKQFGFSRPDHTGGTPNETAGFKDSAEKSPGGHPWWEASPKLPPSVMSLPPDDSTDDAPPPEAEAESDISIILPDSEPLNSGTAPDLRGEALSDGNPAKQQEEEEAEDNNDEIETSDTESISTESNPTPTENSADDEESSQVVSAVSDLSEAGQEITSPQPEISEEGYKPSLGLSTLDSIRRDILEESNGLLK